MNASTADEDLNNIFETLSQGATLIAPECEIEGNLVLHGNISVDGHVVGSVTVDNPDAVLYVSESGEVTGELRAATVYVAGRVKGTVHAAIVTIAGSVDGDIHYTGTLSVKPGADIRGKIDKASSPDDPELEVLPTPPQPRQPAPGARGYPRRPQQSGHRPPPTVLASGMSEVPSVNAPNPDEFGD